MSATLQAYGAVAAPVSIAHAHEDYAAFVARRASPHVGAYIEEIDLSRPLSAAAVGELEEALARHGVLFFRNQELDPRAHIALAERLGEIEVNRFFKAVDGYPQIAEVRKEAGQKANIGGGWHTDHSYDQIPAKASLLYAREVPEIGGDTIFASVEAAFESLSPALQKTLEGLSAVHSSRHVFGRGGNIDASVDLRGRILNPELATQDAVHPVALRNARTGRKGIYVNPGFTLRFDGWTAQESASLLNYLYSQIARPEFSHRFQWAAGSLAIWDNRSTWHLALNDYAGQRRLLHRITVKGEALN
ncbi:MAG TPA: TauD/TfdA family dioxygenase [Rhodoblastus sp.]|nr:TauD/TfdA family dioxygenase [Rhodoblastus sp.]